MSQFFGYRAFSQKLWLQRDGTYRFGRLQRLLVAEAAESSTGQEEGSFHINLPIQRNGSIHPVRPTPMSLCRTGEPPGTGYSALPHL